MKTEVQVERNLPWLGHYDSEVPFTLTYPEVPLTEPFQQSVHIHFNEVALIFFGRKITYRELGQLVGKLAGGFMRSGIKQGDRVGLILANCPQYVISYYAILTIGAIVVPVNPLSTETELLHIFRDGDIKAAIALDLLADRLESVRNTCREAGEEQLLKNVFYTSLREFMPFPLKQLFPLKQKLSPQVKQNLAGCQRFGALLQGPSYSGMPPVVDVHRDVAVLIYTGGTTGKPKGVMLSHSALIANASQCTQWVNMMPKDSLLAVLPLFHGFGMSVCMNAPLIAGGTSILIPRFGVKEILQVIHRFRPTLFAGVPTMYIGLINHPQLKRFDLSSLRGCFVGAAPLPPEIKRQFEELTGSKLMEGYGLTEAVTADCANPYRGVNKTGSIGIPFPDIVMRIRDVETGEQELPAGEVGELVLQGPDLMLGYYNRPEETAAALRNGWLYTGDLGYMDEDGYFYIVDRKKDMIITGGFNVYPREVEDVLYQHPAVKEACVLGVPDTYKGEKVKAFITLKEDNTVEEDEIIAFCRKHLIPYKVPNQVEIRKELPKTVIGKILKRALRDSVSQ